jgi:hypothetical protein
MGAMNFTIPTPRLPTDAELRAWAERHLSAGRPFRVDAWPLVLRDRAGRLVELCLSAEERDALLTMWGVVNGETPGQATVDVATTYLARLEDRLISAVDFWDEGVFVRLNTRSPKDNFDWVDDQGKPQPLTEARGVIRTLLGSMERVTDDLQAAKLLGDTEPVFIVIRPYFRFEPWREVRVFVENGAVAGISQYFYQATFPELPGQMAAWSTTIRETVADLVPQLPWSAFTLDGWMDEAGAFRFLEVNPPVTAGVTDPASFRDGNLDGTFRIRQTHPL